MLKPLGITQGVPPAALVGPEELARELGVERMLRLGSNESPYGPTPRARAAIERELGMLGHYGDPKNHALREALAARHDVKLEQVCVAAGVDDLLGLAVRAYLPPGAAGVTTHGTFPTFDMHVLGFGGRLETVPYATSPVAVDGEQLLARGARCAPCLLYFANPDNPSGTALAWPAVQAMVDRLPAQCLFLHDEAYANFLPASQRPPDDWVDERVIRFRTFSKEYGLAGLRLGYAIGSAEAVAAMEEVRLLYGVSRLALAAGLASLEDDAWVRDVIDRIVAGRREYEMLAGDLGLGFVPSTTNFMLFDFGDVTRANAAREALLRAGIHTRKPMVPPLDGHVRISVGDETARQTLAAELRRIVTGRQGA
jgi:histidinol-phosphate aminotransferase